MSNILLITLQTFSATGGIEKVCRVLGKALYEIATEQGGRLEVLSMYDRPKDATHNAYFPAAIFTGFSQSKLRCVWQAVRRGIKKDLVVLSHVNLLPIGWLIKQFSPSTKIVLLTHGIEIWKPLGNFKKRMLDQCDHIVAVSQFTRQEIISVQGVAAEKITVINNCLDPFLPAASGPEKATALKKSYGLQSNDIVLFCLTRLAATERHKRYDSIIKLIPAIQQHFEQRIVYMIAGKYSDDEAAYIRQTASTAGAAEQVLLTGFVAEEAVATHFEMADAYVMPSTKEGFGIVFIEAMHYGLPVIAGNKDGSADALANGELGILVDPYNEKALQSAIIQLLQHKEKWLPDAALLKQRFGYERYQTKWKQLIMSALKV